MGSGTLVKTIANILRWIADLIDAPPLRVTDISRLEQKYGGRE